MDLQKYLGSACQLWAFDLKKPFDYINKKVKWTNALYVELVLFALYLLVVMLLDSSQVAIDAQLPIVAIVVIAIILGIVSGIVFSFIGYGIVHLFMKLFGGSAHYTDTLKFGLAISVPSTILYLLLDSVSLGTGENIVVVAITGFISALIFIWSFVVSIFAFSKLHKITKLKAFLALIMPIIVILIIAIIIGIIIFTAVGLAF